MDSARGHALAISSRNVDQKKDGRPRIAIKNEDLQDANQGEVNTVTVITYTCSSSRVWV